MLINDGNVLFMDMIAVLCNRKRIRAIQKQNTLPPEMDNVQPTFFTAAARIKIQKNMSGSSLKPLEAR